MDFANVGNHSPYMPLQAAFHERQAAASARVEMARDRASIGLKQGAQAGLAAWTVLLPAMGPLVVVEGIREGSRLSGQVSRLGRVALGGGALVASAASAGILGGALGAGASALNLTPTTAGLAGAVVAGALGALLPAGRPVMLRVANGLAGAVIGGMASYGATKSLP